MTRELPAGTVTFLFTDVEGSTRLLERLGRDAYEETLAFHNRLVRATFATHDGIEVDRHGEGFFAVFGTALDAVRAAVELQRAVGEAAWPSDAATRVRIGINAGDAFVGSEGYIGLPVHEAARIAQTADGGQVLLSTSAARLVGDELDPALRLHDLGEWPLDGFDGRRRLFALTTHPHEPTLPTRLRAATRERLLEREQELGVIEALVRGALPVPFVAVEGRAGIGKTRLVAAAREAAAEAGYDVLFARGAELEQDFGYGLVRQLLEPVLATATPEERDELLAGAAAFAERLFDETELAAALTGGEDLSYPMLHGLYWLAANVGARRPTLLLVDDLHWADAASLRWLCHLVPRLEGVPLLVLLASRPPEQGREPALLMQLLADPGVVALRPGPLQHESVVTLVRELLDAEPDPAFADACLAATGGNPLYLRALLETLAQEGVAPKAQHAARVHEIGPEAVSRTVQVRLSRLPAPAGALANAIAVLGEDAELDHAASLASLERGDADAAAAELARVDLIRIGRPLHFVHPVVRASVYEQLQHSERAAAHRAAAELLAADGATPERIAAHLLLTEPAGDPFVVEILREAAPRSLARGVSDAAVAYLRRALEEPPEDRSRVLYELGLAELMIDGHAAVEHLRETTRLESRPVEHAVGALAYGRALWFMGEHKAALDVFRAAISTLPEDERELRERLDAEVISSALWEPEQVPIALEHVKRVRVEELTESLGGRMLLASLAFFNARRGEDREQAVEYVRRAFEGGILRRGNPIAFYLGIFVLVMADEFEEALSTYDGALADACRRGDPSSASVVHTFRGFTRLRLGDLAEALDDLRQAVDLARSVEIETVYPYATAFLAQALLESGDVEGAAEALHALPIPDPLPASGHFFFYRTSRGLVRIAQGEREEGVRELLQLGESIQGLEVGEAAWSSWRQRAARTLLELGERDRALELAHAEVEAQRRWGAPRSLGIALTTLGVVEGGEAGESQLGEAIEILEESPAKLARARALFELGASLRRRNRRTEGREFLGRALELAAACGAAGLAADAHAELLASGARPRTTAVAGAAALTPSETRVAKLAADGLTNREIAQALFVTPKTVEVHLSSAYRKLDISSRMQLAGALA